VDSHIDKSSYCKMPIPLTLSVLYSQWQVNLLSLVNNSVELQDWMHVNWPLLLSPSCLPYWRLNSGLSTCLSSTLYHWTTLQSVNSSLVIWKIGNQVMIFLSFSPLSYIHTHTHTHTHTCMEVHTQIHRCTHIEYIKHIYLA
jgi:hypothetical protein